MVRRNRRRFRHHLHHHSRNLAMDGPTRDYRTLLTMDAKDNNKRFVALPAENGQWEIRDIVECKTYILGENIQCAICECVAKILNLKDAENEKHL